MSHFLGRSIKLQILIYCEHNRLKSPTLQCNERSDIRMLDIPAQLEIQCGQSLDILPVLASFQEACLLLSNNVGSGRKPSVELTNRVWQRYWQTVSWLPQAAALVDPCCPFYLILDDLFLQTNRGRDMCQSSSRGIFTDSFTVFVILVEFLSEW